MKRSTSMNNLESISDPVPQKFQHAVPIRRHYSEDVPRCVDQHAKYYSRSFDSLLEYGSHSGLSYDSAAVVIQHNYSMSASPSFPASSVVSDEERTSVGEGSELYSTIPTIADDIRMPLDGVCCSLQRMNTPPEDSSIVCRLIHRKDLGFDEAVSGHDDQNTMIVGAEWHPSEQSEVDFQINALDAILDEHSNMLVDPTPPSVEPQSQVLSRESPMAHVSFASVEGLKDHRYSKQQCDSECAPLIRKLPVESTALQITCGPPDRITVSAEVSCQNGGEKNRHSDEEVDTLSYDENIFCETPRELAAISERREDSLTEDDASCSQQHLLSGMHQASVSVVPSDENASLTNKGGARPSPNHSPANVHRRWLSDHTAERTVCDSKERLAEQIRRENEMCEQVITMRRVDVRNGTLSSRCRSQLLLGRGEPPTTWSGHSSLEIMHTCLSTSTPSVSDSQQLDQHQGERRIGNATPDARDGEKVRPEAAVERIDAATVERNWAQLLPATFGAHQVIGPVQRPTRLVPNLNVVTDSNAKWGDKRRLEKKQSRRSSGLLDFFPSYRKRRSDLHATSAGPDTHGVDRRSTVDGGEPPITGLPDSLVKALQDRPNTIGVTDGRYVAARVAGAFSHFLPQLNKPKWSDLELWKEEPLSWSACNPHAKLGKQERKKQDLIYEIYLTEKHYCQVLVVLQQVYQEGLRVKKILSEAQRAELIPPVLDALLDFHLSLLRQIRSKRSEAVLVDSISRIIYLEFERTERSQAAAHAYTEVCSKKDQCGRLYDEWYSKNIEMRRFFDKYEKDSTYKDRTFKMCLLLIAQRLTKYPILLEQLSKVESAAFNEDTKRAHIAVKAFALRVNSELAKIEINRRWDRIRSRIDRSSVGRINQNDLFTYDDLVLTGSTDQRHVLCIGGAQCHSTQQKPEEGTEVVLILFDDVLVLLATPGGKNDKYTFCDRGPTGCSVIALNTLMVRDMPRNTSVFLVVDLKPCFDLFVVTFATKSDLEEWKRAIEAAKERVPSRVRRAHALANKPTVEPREEDLEEIRFNAEMEEWEMYLKALFERRKREERQLADYIEKRLEWFGMLRQHIEHIPVKNGSVAQKGAISEKIKAGIKEKFAELRAMRRSSLNAMAECAARLNEEDFRSYFDDAHDASVTASDSTTSSDHSESDENRSRLPKRNRTFHGTALPHRGASDTSIRRHTTEPQLGERKRLEEEIDAAVDEEKVHKLALGLSSPARRAAAQLIRENVRLRVENNKLRSDVALQELQLASLKTRRLAATPVNALEALRKKQQELQNEEMAFRSKYDLQMAQITEREEMLSIKEKELKAREEQLEEQWKAFYEVNNVDTVSLHRPLGSARPLHAANATFRSGSAINERSSAISPQAGPLGRSPSSSSMPLHLAEKTSKICRTKKF